MFRPNRAAMKWKTATEVIPSTAMPDTINVLKTPEIMEWSSTGRSIVQPFISTIQGSPLGHKNADSKFSSAVGHKTDESSTAVGLSTTQTVECTSRHDHSIEANSRQFENDVAQFEKNSELSESSETKSLSHSSRRGKGHGVKNLAAMRARSVTSSSDLVADITEATSTLASSLDDINVTIDADLIDKSTDTDTPTTTSAKTSPKPETGGTQSNLTNSNVINDTSTASTQSKTLQFFDVEGPEKAHCDDSSTTAIEPNEEIFVDDTVVIAEPIPESATIETYTKPILESITIESTAKPITVSTTTESTTKPNPELTTIESTTQSIPESTDIESVTKPIKESTTVESTTQTIPESKIIELITAETASKAVLIVNTSPANNELPMSITGSMKSPDTKN